MMAIILAYYARARGRSPACNLRKQHSTRTYTVFTMRGAASAGQLAPRLPKKDRFQDDAANLNEF